MNSGMIFDIEHGSCVDGPGVRSTVFFKGCNLHCAWCHNPESQSPLPELLFFSDRCEGCGVCARVCPNRLQSCQACAACTETCPAGARRLYGHTMTAEEILTELEEQIPFFEASGGGVTFSGGECLLQINLLEELLRACRARGIHTAVDTAGHIAWERIARILPLTDLFLYDVKCLDPVLHERYVGVDNRLILQNLQRLLQSDTAVRVRIPVIHGINDTVGEMQKIRALLEEWGMPQRVELLPYHAMGDSKYRAMGRIAPTFQAPDKAHMKELRAVFGD